MKRRERKPWHDFAQATIVDKSPLRESTSESIRGGNCASEMDGVQFTWKSDSFFNRVQGLKMDRGNPPIRVMDTSMTPGNKRQSRKALRNVAGKSDSTNSSVLLGLLVPSM